MATIQKSWATPVTLAQTDFYGGSTPDLAADQAYDYTANVDLETNGYEDAHITVDYDGNGTTDNIIISVFASLDGTNYDDIELTSFPGSKTGNDEQVSFVIKDVANFRIGVKTSGTTNTFGYQIKYQAWRYTSV